ncbi:MAG TPA: hypothetical protein VJ876_07380 [Bacteroidales bacterium]|nr:hypothetical protein [Bacteroidales bacterium]
MTTRILSLMLLAAALLSCSGPNGGEDSQTSQNNPVLQVTQVTDDPVQYIDQKITIEGMVTHVCRHGGKRLHLSKAGSDEMIRVRTGENMTPFKRELEGSTIEVTGTFIEERMDQEYLDKLKKGQESAESHDHHEGDHSEGNEQATGEQADVEQGQVSEAYIQELETKINSSEKGYISEYWLTAESVKKPQ